MLVSVVQLSESVTLQSKKKKVRAKEFTKGKKKGLIQMFQNRDPTRGDAGSWGYFKKSGPEDF